MECANPGAPPPLDAARPPAASSEKARLVRGVEFRRQEAFPPFMVLPVFFLLLAITIVANMRSTEARFDVQQGLAAQYAGSFADDVSGVESFWNWLNLTLLPAVVAGASLPGNSTGARTGLSTPLLLLMTQTRDTCDAPPPPAAEREFAYLAFNREPGAAPVTWGPLVEAGVCANTSSGSSGSALRSFADRPMLVDFVATAKATGVINKTLLAQLADPYLCWAACGDEGGCDVWSVNHTATANHTASSGGNGSGAAALCTLFSDATAPPQLRAGNCTSGQPVRSYSYFGANWQCPGPAARPRYNAPLSSSAQSSLTLGTELQSASLHDSFFKCEYPDSSFGGGEPSSCVALGGTYDGFARAGALASTLRRLGWIDRNTSCATIQVYGLNEYIPGRAFTLASFQVCFTPGGRTLVASRTSSVLPALSEAAEPPPLMIFLVVLFVAHIVWSNAYQLQEMLRHARASRLREFARRHGLWMVVEGAVGLFSLSLVFAYFSQATVIERASNAFKGCGGIVGVMFGFPDEQACEAVAPYLNSASNVIVPCTAGKCVRPGADRLLLANAAFARFVSAIKTYLAVDDQTKFAGTAVIYMLTFRLFRFFRLQPRLAIITNTLRKALPDLLHFGLVFMLVLVGFAASAWCNFGDGVAGFATAGASLFETFYMAMGNYDDAYASMVGVSVVGARLFLLPFLFLVVLVLLNIFLAIVVDSYGDVKDELQNEDAVPSIVDSSLVKLSMLHRAAQRTTARALGTARSSGAEAYGQLGGWGARRRRSSGPGIGQDIEMTGAAAAGVGVGGVGGKPRRGKRIRWPEMLKALDAVGDVEFVTPELLQQHVPGIGLEQAHGVLRKYSGYAELADHDAARAAGRVVVAAEPSGVADAESFDHPGEGGKAVRILRHRDGEDHAAPAAVSLAPDELARVVGEACDQRLEPVLRKLDELLRAQQQKGV